MSTEIIREGSWKCPNCQTRNRGREVKCSACGQAREGVAFEYDEGAAAVGDAEGLSLAHGGADWLCGYCGTSNRSGTGSCRQCAGERKDGKVRETGDWTPPGAKPSGAAASRNADAFVLPSWEKRLAAGFSLLILFLTFLATRERDRVVTIASVAWERSIEVQKVMPVVESDWVLPARAREISRRSEVHHQRQVLIGRHSVKRTTTERVMTGTRQVKSGTKDMGNGFFKDVYRTEPIYENRPRERWVEEPIYRHEPVYQTRYTYEVQRWKTLRTERASGDGTAAAWPDAKLAPGEREGPRAENYRVDVKDDAGKSYPFEPDAVTFASLEVGARRGAIFDGFGRFKGLKK